MNAATAQQYARWVGVLYAITIVAGGWGESYVPNTLLVANDLAGTVHHVASSVGIFRGSFAAYLVEAACDITLNVLLYALLRPVSRTLALLAACFGLMGTAVFAAGEMLYFAAALPAVDADVARVVAQDAKAALTYLCLTIFGAIVMFGGASFIVKNIVIVLAPQYDLPYVIFPMFLAMASLMLWLLIKGIDRAGWDAMQVTTSGRPSRNPD